MTSKKKQSKNSSPPDEPIDDNVAGQEQTPEDSPPELEDLPPELEELPPELSPAEKLLDMAVTAWAMSSLMKPVFHFMGRMFAHWNSNTPYGAKYVFQQFEAMNNGNPEELLEKIEAFREEILELYRQKDTDTHHK